MADALPARTYRGSLDSVIARVRAARGIDLSQYRRSYLERRLGSRLRSLDLHSYRQYVEALDTDPEEYLRLIGALTINVTDFFRDPVVWESLRRNVFVPLVESKRAGGRRSIRAWSAGCASGEEAYSVAMSLLDAVGDDARLTVSVLGTDLDPEALEKAERGVYPVSALERFPKDYQVRFTRSVDEGAFEVSPDVRRVVRFRQASLFGQPPVSVVDVLSCRNVFIYLDHDRQAAVLDSFWHALARGGYLVLGRSEKLSVQAAGRFEPIDGRERIYRKSGHVREA